MPFRDFSYPTVLRKLDLTEQQGDLSEGLLPRAASAEFAAFLAEGLSIAVPDLGVGTEKAKSEFIVAPLLMELRRTMERRFSIFSGMELNVNKGRGLNGACDYILTKGGNQHLREAPIIGIVETKNEEFALQGLGQCIAAMVAALCRNQKYNWPITQVCGIVTTGRRWVFLHLQGCVLTRDRERHYLQEPDLGALLGVLRRQIERVLFPAPVSFAAALTESSDTPVNSLPS